MREREVCPSVGKKERPGRGEFFVSGAGPASLFQHFDNEGKEGGAGLAID